MEFLIVSDSHGNADAIRRALSRQVRLPDAIFFLGDGLRDVGDRLEDVPVIRVRGNCDWTGPEEVPEEVCLSFEGHRILLTHGHRYGVKSGTGGLLSAAAARGADLVCYGHTHRPDLETVPAGTGALSGPLPEAVTLFNPGSIGQDGSFGTLTLERETVLFAHGTLSGKRV